MKSTIRLFKAVPITAKRKKTNKDLMAKTIRRGYIFAPEVVFNYPDIENLVYLVAEEYGMTAEKLNESFHKSWLKIKEADIEQLVIEQIAHYLTTYGKEDPKGYLIEKEEQWGVDHLAEKIIDLGDFESDKIHDENYVYIPKEKLEIPGIEIDDIKLVVIRGLTKKKLKEKLLGLLGLGVALKADTITDVLDVAVFLGLSEKDIVGVKNKEVKSALYEYLGIVPGNPTEFLRFIVYKATEETLLIKNENLIEKIKESKSLSVVRYFKDYEKQHGLERLAEIFLRFKPLFLAFKSNDRLKPTVNRIRRLAVKHHKPMPEDYLNTITAKLKRNVVLDVGKLKSELERVNTFRKVRLAYALNFRMKDVDSILYRIRNGKGYATKFSFDSTPATGFVFDSVLKSIVKDVAKNVKGKKIFIPDYIHYSLPATEKMFTGNFPSGTYVSIPKDMIVGIHWENVTGRSVDLDLSLISPESGKIGWDSSYRTEARDILFSGDLTDARKPKGATELFYVQRQRENGLILHVNYYNFNEDTEVPFKIIVAKEKAENFEKNYMVDPNNLITTVASNINRKEKVLGLLVSTLHESRFYFAESYVGGSITSSQTEFAEHSRKYLFDFYQNTIGLRDILIKAEVKIVDEKEEADIDLSPENLEKDTILNLFKGET